MRTDRRINFVEMKIQEFIEMWKDKEPDFVSYFVSYYVRRKEQWAVCYRDSSIPDTTAHAESFHNLLKRVSANKRNKYMKILLETLMRMEEDYKLKFKG